MGDKTAISLEFPEARFQGELINSEGLKTPVGREGFLPYELLLGALGECFYVTMLEVMKKQRLTRARKISVAVSGEKRDEIPTTLKEASIVVTLYGVADGEEKKVEKAAGLAAEYCSIHEALTKVGTVTHQLIFEK